jgi:hypothetical protein
MALAQRKGCPGSRLAVVCLAFHTVRSKNFLQKRLELRIAAQRIEERIGLYEGNIVSIPIIVSFFEQMYGFVLLTESI